MPPHRLLDDVANTGIELTRVRRPEDHGSLPARVLRQSAATLTFA